MTGKFLGISISSHSVYVFPFKNTLSTVQEVPSSISSAYILTQSARNVTKRQRAGA